MECAYCHEVFRPRRSTARYCGDRCRKRASRPDSVPQPQKGRPRAFLSVRGHPTTPNPGWGPPDAPVTLIHQQIRAPKSLPNGMVADARWPGMYRLINPDGSLSVMVNLTRAKDELCRRRELAQRSP
jgi:hypothetical protein